MSGFPSRNPARKQKRRHLFFFFFSLAHVWDLNYWARVLGLGKWLADLNVGKERATRAHIFRKLCLTFSSQILSVFLGCSFALAQWFVMPTQIWSQFLWFGCAAPRFPIPSFEFHYRCQVAADNLVLLGAKVIIFFQVFCFFPAFHRSAKMDCPITDDTVILSLISLTFSLWGRMVFSGNGANWHFSVWGMTMGISQILRVMPADLCVLLRDIKSALRLDCDYPFRGLRGAMEPPPPHRYLIVGSYGNAFCSNLVHRG